jgi:PTH1 family peptidyl-tRNA hydrolase
MPVDYIVAGLGNPGLAYRGTRHNAGAALIEELSKRHSIPLTGKKYRSLTGRGIISGRDCLLALPQTYMNLSGQAVRRMLTYTGAPLSHLVIACDDLDLPLGRIRLRLGGGSGGHRGLSSIIESTAGNIFIRLRIGIGRPPGNMAAEEYVLKRFNRTETPLVGETIDRAAQAVETLLSQGIDKAMSLFNGSP